MPQTGKTEARILTRRDWPRIMDAAREIFPAGNPYGVFAFGVGPSVTRGHRTRTVGLNVYVAKKHAAPVVHVPVVEARIGKRVLSLRPNVVAAGRRPTASAAGDPELGGLYAGAPIRVDGRPAVFGGVACFVGAGDQPTHLLTAGHLFSPNAAGATVSAAAAPGGTPFAIGELAVNLLDGAAIDAAAVELNDAGRELLADGDSGPRLVDSLAEPSVWDKPVRAFRPTTNDYSRATRTTTGPLDAFLDCDARGSYWVRDIIGTDGTVTEVGDSGTVLCAGASNQFALGLCVGEYQLHSIAEPVGRVLQHLSAAIGAVRLIATRTSRG